MQSTPFVVEDASRDERFQSNPYVAGEPHLRFYAGIPLMTHSGLALGTICALDFHPRRIGYRELEIMSSVARLVVRFLDVRKAALEDPFTGRPLPERLRDTYNDAA